MSAVSSSYNLRDRDSKSPDSFIRRLEESRNHSLSIQCLDLTGMCNLTDKHVCRLTGLCPNLERLVINSDKITRISLIALSNLHALAELTLIGCDGLDGLPDQMGKLSFLRKFVVKECAQNYMITNDARRTLNPQCFIECEGSGSGLEEMSDEELFSLPFDQFVQVMHGQHVVNYTPETRAFVDRLFQDNDNSQSRDRNIPRH